MRKRIVAVLLCVVCLLSMTALLAGCQIDFETTFKEFTVNNGGDFKVGVLSDTQLPQDGSGGQYADNLVKALTELKERDVDMIIFAGDITDAVSPEAYDTYMQCYDKVYGDGERPIIQHIMGNHDYWEGEKYGLHSTEDYRELFTAKTGQNAHTHYVVNGYHFIGASPDSGNMDNGYKKSTDWLEAEIDKAVSDDPTKPVFVTTHNSAKDTVYGSEDWGDKKLYNVLSKYENVVSISGHLHYSLLDERSMWQGDFTAIGTQSVSYTEMEAGKENGTIPPDHSATPMGYIMDISASKVDIHRINFASGEYEKEDMLWTLPIPLTKAGFNYTTQKRQEANSIPTMPAGDVRASNENGVTYLSFPAGSDDDFVHSYKVVFNGDEKNAQLYFSDFYNGIGAMDKTVKLPIYGKSAGQYDIKIYAVDSYGKVSNNCLEIKGINVLKAEYKK